LDAERVLQCSSTYRHVTTDDHPDRRSLFRADGTFDDLVLDEPSPVPSMSGS
jgi:hypothetical protein